MAIMIWKLLNALPLSPRVALSLLDGDRMVRLGVDAAVVEVLEHLVAPVDLDHVDVVDVTVARHLVGQLDPLQALQTLGVHGRDLAATVAPHARDGWVSEVDSGWRSCTIYWVTFPSFRSIV